VNLSALSLFQTVKNEVNVPCLKNFVERLYSATLDMCTRGKHRLNIFPLVTCLLCVSQKAFFLHNWHYFLAMCLQHLKNKDSKIARVALESLYRLLWVYMIRIKCERNDITQSRLQAIVASLFPKGSKNVVPRDTPLTLFVKIIQFIAQEKLDFAMREIVFELLSVGKQPIRVINAPERMSIGLRAFLVVADGLQQKEGEPPMPRTLGPLPSGASAGPQRVKKTYLSKTLTEEAARQIGVSPYYPYVRKCFDDILRALDAHYGRPFLMISVSAATAAKEAEDAKPKLDLFRTVVAAIPRLLPDGMSRSELVDTLSRLTVHHDEELRGLAQFGLQNLVIDFPEWREDVLFGFMQFVVKDIVDQQTTLLDNALRVVCSPLAAWRSAAQKEAEEEDNNDSEHKVKQRAPHLDFASTLHMAEGFALVMLCHCRLTARKICLALLKEVKQLYPYCTSSFSSKPVLDALDAHAASVVAEIAHLMPANERIVAAAVSPEVLDFQWLAERGSPHWTSGFNEEGAAVKTAGGNHYSAGKAMSPPPPTTSSSPQSLFLTDPWSAALIAFLAPDRLPADCPSAVYHTWTTVHVRITQLYAIVDPK